MQHTYDVIIIGAGISGMVAAHTLLEKEPSLDIVILEATDRIGGRTLSLPVKVNTYQTCLFDFGGHWISSSQVHVKKYIDILKLRLVPQQRGIAIGASNRKSFSTYLEHPIIGHIFTRYEIHWFFAKLEEQSGLYAFGKTYNSFTTEFYDCISMEYYINSKMYTEAAKNVVKNMIKIITGIDAAQISVMYYLLLCNSSLGFTNQYMTIDGGAREFWIQEGAEEICNQIKNIIGEELIKLKQPATEIHHSSISGENKIVTSSGNTYYATQVICALPLEQVSKIKFQPALNRNRTLILEEIQTGHITKFVITYATPFWRLQNYSAEIFACNAGPVSVCYDATKNDNPALMGYINDPTSFKGSDGTCKVKVLEQLVQYWGKEATNIIEYKEIYWRDRPYTGGCPMSCAGLEIMKWHQILTKPVGRIHWAGTELATEWNGFMNGAIQSGYRAGIETLYDIRPQMITFQDLAYVNTRRNHIIRLKNLKIPKTVQVVVTLVACYYVYKYFIKELLK